LDAKLKIDDNKITLFNRPGMPLEQYRKIAKQITDEIVSQGTSYEFSIETEAPNRDGPNGLLLIFIQHS